MEEAVKMTDNFPKDCIVKSANYKMLFLFGEKSD